jgi:8-oxo-dGTP diphosphatase
MTRFALQFGQTQPGLTYVELTAAHGVCARGDRELAIVRLGQGRDAQFELPGGSVQAQEEEAAALMREFLEETGLSIWPARVIGRAGQYWINQGAARNNLATFYEVELSGQDAEPTGAGHALIWLAPQEAMAKVRHEAHAWAILHWLRARSVTREELGAANGR